MFDATYKNLLELFLKADHKECADTICTVLNRRGNYKLVHTSPLFRVYLLTQCMQLSESTKKGLTNSYRYLTTITSSNQGPNFVL